MLPCRHDFIKTTRWIITGFERPSRGKNEREKKFFEKTPLSVTAAFGDAQKLKLSRLSRLGTVSRNFFESLSEDIIDFLSHGVKIKGREKDR